MRIRIFGGPGSGKSTLAKELTKRYGWKHIETDDIRWASPHDYSLARDNKEKISLLNPLLKQKDWIIEGTTGSDWSWPSFTKADLVIVLKNKLYKDKIRIMKRTLKRFFGIEKNKRKERFNAVIELFRWANQFNKEVYPKTLSRLQLQKISYSVFKNCSKALAYIEEKIK